MLHSLHLVLVFLVHLFCLTGVVFLLLFILVHLFLVCVFVGVFLVLAVMALLVVRLWLLLLLYLCVGEGGRAAEINYRTKGMRDGASVARDP